MQNLRDELQDYVNYKKIIKIMEYGEKYEIEERRDVLKSKCRDTLGDEFRCMLRAIATSLRQYYFIHSTRHLSRGIRIFTE